MIGSFIGVVRKDNVLGAQNGASKEQQVHADVSFTVCCCP